MAKKSNPFTDPMLKKILKQAEKDFMKCARRINKDIHEDVRKMYRTFIQQFYDYQTTSYVRHFEGIPGTRYGENLRYPEEGIRFNNRAKHSPRLYIDFWASEMSNSPAYEYHKPEEVLDYVMHGVRFATGRGYQMLANTTFEYKGKYFQYSGDTIQGAFDEFGRQWDEISNKAFYSIWDEYVSKWKF